MAAGTAEDTLGMPEGSVGGRTLGGLWARIRRYWPLVVVVVWVAAFGAVVATERAPTTYVGRTSLIVSSNDRSPDQDAVLVQGYIDYFNDGSYQQQLLSTAGVTGDVSLSATTAAASPILVISATTSDPATAQSYAIEVANAFKDDINRVRAESTARELAALQDQLDTALASDNPDAEAVVVNLQNRIEQLRSDQVNVLQELQQQGGVSVQSPSLSGNLVPAVAGGLLIGSLAALVLGGLSRRLHDGHDVADKIGLRTLVELPRPRGRTGRPRQARRLGQLANIVRTQLPGPGVVAVAQPEAGIAATVVARELAREWARQGYPTVLVDTDGSGDLDAAEAISPQVRLGDLQGLSFLHLAPRSTDDAPVLSVSKVGELLQQETLAGQYVVIEAQAVVRSTTAQAICHAADQTVLVVDTTVSRVPSAREAVAVLRHMGANVMGAVVASLSGDAGEEDVPDRRPSPPPGRHAEGSYRPTAELDGHGGRPPAGDTASAIPSRGAQSGPE
ncbi:hypothetical protein ACI8AK_09980 [Geodermatophilus sp. SYSU D00867]